MARKRYYRPRRRSQNTVWQSHVQTETLALSTTDSSRHINGLLPGWELSPGIVGNEFTDDHTLERVVGTMAHNARSGPNLISNTSWFPFTFAAVRVPRGLTISQAWNLWDNSQGDDFVFRMDAVCNAAQSSDAMPNWHEVNAKARRKFEVGDKMAFAYTLYTDFSDSSFYLDLVVNLRFLWKLKV